MLLIRIVEYLGDGMFKTVA